MIVVTQCSMRHLYKAKDEPGVSYCIDKAKTYERRRCGHHPEEFPEPLSENECLSSVVDPKGSKHNKHRYVVASQDIEVRKSMRTVLGVPMVYINRSVMIMEPMASSTTDNREKEERVKFRAGLKRGSGSLKRKREDASDGDVEGHKENTTEDVPKKKKKVKGPKGPNPLSIKKSKKRAEEDDATSVNVEKKSKDPALESLPSLGLVDASDETAKRKRKRKPKSGADGGVSAVSEVAEDGE